MKNGVRSILIRKMVAELLMIKNNQNLYFTKVIIIRKRINVSSYLMNMVLKKVIKQVIR